MGLKPFGFTNDVSEKKTEESIEKTNTEEVREFAGWLAPDPEVVSDEVEDASEEVVSEEVDDAQEPAEVEMTLEEFSAEEDEDYSEVEATNEEETDASAEFTIELPVSALEDVVRVGVDLSSSASAFSEKAARSYYSCDDPTLEAIQVIDSYLMNFSEGSAYKYIIRAGRKDDLAIKDMEKAIGFLQHLKNRKTPVLRSIDNSVPSACRIIAAFKLDFFSGSALDNLLEYLVSGETSRLDKSIEMLEWKISSLKGENA